MNRVFPVHATTFCTVLLVDDEGKQAILRIRPRAGAHEATGEIEVELIDDDEVVHGDGVRLFEQVDGHELVTLWCVSVTKAGISVAGWTDVTTIKVLEN